MIKWAKTEEELKALSYEELNQLMQQAIEQKLVDVAYMYQILMLNKRINEVQQENINLKELCVKLERRIDILEHNSRNDYFW